VEREEAGSAITGAVCLLVAGGIAAIIAHIAVSECTFAPGLGHLHPDHQIGLKAVAKLGQLHRQRSYRLEFGYWS